MVSSSPRVALERGLAAHDLGGLFASIIAGDDGFGHKPDALPFAETLARIGATAEDRLVMAIRMWIFWRGGRRAAGPVGLRRRKTRCSTTLRALQP